MSLAPLRFAVPLGAALAALACGGVAERPDPPSAPPIQAAAAAEPARPVEPARPAPDAPPDPSPALPAAPVEPRPVAAAPGESPQTPSSEPPAPPDPLQWLADRQAREEAERVRLAAAERAVEDARARVAELESRLLAVKNPFLPRPALPPEEAAAWEGLDGVARAQRVEGQLVEARAELDRAEQALAALRAG